MVGVRMRQFLRVTSQRRALVAHRAQLAPRVGDCLSAEVLRRRDPARTQDQETVVRYSRNAGYQCAGAVLSLYSSRSVTNADQMPPSPSATWSWGRQNL